jgi:hypothetical protein
MMCGIYNCSTVPWTAVLLVKLRPPEGDLGPISDALPTNSVHIALRRLFLTQSQADAICSKDDDGLGKESVAVWQIFKFLSATEPKHNHRVILERLSRYALRSAHKSGDEIAEFILTEQVGVAVTL